MTNIIDFESFVNESRIPIAWAKPSSLTTTILSFIDEKQKVSKKELVEFIDGIPEDSSGKKPNMSWIRNHKKYVKYKVEEEEANYFSLTPLGRRVLKSAKINETTEDNSTKIIK